MTVAYYYDNCVDLSQWTTTGEWKTNSEAYISQSSAFLGKWAIFHVFFYVNFDINRPVFMADDVSGHNAAIATHSSAGGVVQVTR